MKKAGLPVEAIVALFIVGATILIISSFWLFNIFGGGERLAFDTLKDNLNKLCEADSDTPMEFHLFVPDSIGTSDNIMYLYYVIEPIGDKRFLILKSRPPGKTGDYIVDTAQWYKEQAEKTAAEALGFEYNKIKILKEAELEKCKRIDICGGKETGFCSLEQYNDNIDKCTCKGSFAFESNYNKELLIFDLYKTDGAVLFRDIKKT